MDVEPDLVMVAAIGRPGTYDVAVRKAGYHDWNRSGVRVRRLGACDVETARLDARLQPVP